MANSKIILITGGNSGIGKAASVKLAKLGNEIIITTRNKEKGEEAVREIIKKSGNKKVSSITLNLSSLNSIRNGITEFLKSSSCLNVFISNAGVINNNRIITEDGFEEQFQVNHLAPFLITNLLQNLLIKSSPSRIIITSSQTYKNSEIDFDDLQNEKNYDMHKVYSQTKLMNMLFTYHLANKLKDKNVTVNCLHPGVVATNLLNDYHNRPRALNFLSKLKNMSPEEGAETTVFLATSSEINGTTGKYFNNKKEEPTNDYSKKEEISNRLWNMSEELLKKYLVESKALNT